jgi:hypothetical protein
MQILELRNIFVLDVFVVKFATKLEQGNLDLLISVLTTMETV